MPYKNNFLQGKLEFARGGSWSLLKAMMLATGASITELKKQMYVPPTHHVQVTNVLIYAFKTSANMHVIKLVFKFTRAGGQTLDLCYLSLFSLNFAAPKTTRLLLHLSFISLF